jgi:hypothetical protein
LRAIGGDLGGGIEPIDNTVRLLDKRHYHFSPLGRENGAEIRKSGAVFD